MRLVIVSDTHGFCPFLPDGDVLIHAGDMTGRGRMDQIEDAASWIASRPHPHKVVIAGNHDWALYRENERTEAERRLTDRGIHYLRDSGVEIGGLTFWGSPWTPEFCGWAFMRPSGSDEVRRHYARIPIGLDVLVTHGPPLGVLDGAEHGGKTGCPLLRDAVRRVRPRIHAFGHIHEARGEVEIDGTRFINAATCTLGYDPINPPIVVDIERDAGGEGARLGNVGTPAQPADTPEA